MTRQSSPIHYTTAVPGSAKTFVRAAAFLPPPQNMRGLANIYNALAPSWYPRVLDWEKGFRPMCDLRQVGGITQEPVEGILYWCSLDSRFYVRLRLDDYVAWYRSDVLSGETLQRLNPPVHVDVMA